MAWRGPWRRSQSHLNVFAVKFEGEQSAISDSVCKSATRRI